MILSNSRVQVWDFIDAAITVASLDYGDELKDRRDRIVERLYASSTSQCRNCESDRNKTSMEKENRHERQKEGSPSTPQSIRGDDDDEDEEVRDPYGGLFDDEETKVLRIKERLEDPNQVLLQSGL